MASTPDAFDLSERVAVVTGGTRGIGRAISIGLAAAGADVVPTSRTREDVASAAAAVREAGGRTLELTTDVTETDDLEALFDRTAAELGGVDVVVQNAGINPDAALGAPDDVAMEGFDRTTDVNLRAAFDGARLAGEYLRESAAEGPDVPGSLITVASVGGLVGLPRQHPYVASKHGVVGLTKSLALDWAPEVRVNAIAPGYVATELTTELREDDGLRRSILDRTPQGRFAEPEEIAGPAVFLASDAASFVTGSCLTVDGGWTAR